MWKYKKKKDKRKYESIKDNNGDEILDNNGNNIEIYSVLDFDGKNWNKEPEKEAKKWKIKT
ncbi:hypothetical protein DLH72_05000 [Candidatus Gracilibacteria bacterium]|nr:MAG: hypothetical protein DLH72_05000 [Candidatus Gracilibacteria bacterium]